jgi:hypothetical protein
MTVVYNIILFDDTVGPLVRIKNSHSSSCTLLQRGHQNRNQTASEMIRHKRSDRGQQSNHFALIEQNGNVSKRDNSCEQGKPMQVLKQSVIKSVINDVTSPSSLGIKPVSGLESVPIEWQGNVNKRDIPLNRRH